MEFLFNSKSTSKIQNVRAKKVPQSLGRKDTSLFTIHYATLYFTITMTLKTEIVGTVLLDIRASKILVH